MEKLKLPQTGQPPQLWITLFRWTVTIGWIVIMLALLLQSSGRPMVGPAAPPGSPDLGREIYLMIGHIVGFAVLTLVLWWALVANLSVSRALMMAVVFALIFGIVTELLQTLVIDRTASWFDLGVNTLVTLMVGYMIRILKPD
jgi:VanZ family protein